MSLFLTFLSQDWLKVLCTQEAHNLQDEVHVGWGGEGVAIAKREAQAHFLNMLQTWQSDLNPLSQSHWVDNLNLQFKDES